MRMFCRCYNVLNNFMKKSLLLTVLSLCFSAQVSFALKEAQEDSAQFIIDRIVYRKLTDSTVKVMGSTYAPEDRGYSIVIPSYVQKPRPRSEDDLHSMTWDGYNQLLYTLLVGEDVFWENIWDIDWETLFDDVPADWGPFRDSFSGIDPNPILDDFEKKLNAFLDYTSLTVEWKGIPDVVFRVDAIEPNAFEDDHVRYLVLPPSLTIIGSDAFNHCDRLEMIYTSKKITCTSQDHYLDRIVEDITAELPPSLTIIGDYAFAYCFVLTSTSIPGSLRYWGYRAFYDCLQLRSVTIKEGLDEIPEEMFLRCWNLSSVSFPRSVKTIHKKAFASCEALNSSLPPCVTAIHDSAFYKCYSLCVASFPESIETIGDGAFYQCGSVPTPHKFDMLLPKSLKTIGKRAFYGNDWISVIKSSLEHITVEAFSCCANLYAVYLPNSIKYVDDAAFKDCPALDEIHLLMENPESVVFGSKVFAGAQSDCKIYVPAGLETNYGWHPDFGNANPFLWNGIEVAAHIYTLSSVSGDINAGEVNPEFSGKYKYATKVTATASPRFGSYLACWTDGDGQILSYDNPYTFPVTASVNLKANFKDISIAVSAGAHGSADFSRDWYLYNDQVFIVAIPDSGYVFAGWEDLNNHNQIISTENPHTLTVDGELSVRAKFSPDKYQINFLSEEHGYLRYYDTVFDYLTAAEVHAVADSDYHFAHWEDEDGNILSTDNPFIFNVVASATVKGVFEPDLYDISVFTEHGTIAPYEKRMPYNTTAEIRAVPDSGYKLVKWTDEKGHVLSTDNPYSFPVVGNANLWAVIEWASFRVTFPDAFGGKAEPDKPFYEKGEHAELRAIPNSGYSFVGWINNSSSYLISTDNPFTIEVNTDIDLFYPYFALVGSLVNTAVKGGGRVIQEAYILNQAAELTAVPAEGYHFKGWSDMKGNSVTTDNPYRFKVTGAVDLIAHFEPNLCTVILSAENGSIRFGSGSFSYPYGTVRLLEAYSTETDFIFSGWIASDGTVLSRENPYPLVVSGDISLCAKFTKSSNIRSGEGGYIRNDSESLPSSAWTTYTAVPYGGYHFVGWKTGYTNYLSVVSVNPSLTVRADETIGYLAVFEPLTGFETLSGVASEGSIRWYNNTLHITGLQDDIITVTSLNGRQLLRFKADSDDVQYPACLSKGVYIVKTSSGKTRKFITGINP
ncbi:hypothetical protein Barb6_01247 [Bacteroidales bacterium Barb6]|nr:hypothetical protein Barb6_01247 [Bacteroidales bacterium Barb6]